MARSSMTIATVLAITLAGPPAVAAVDSPATASYNPWLAAGLNYAPIAPIAAGMALSGGGTLTNPVWSSMGLAFTINPYPGLGHVYVGEPMRGLGFLGASLGLLLTTVAANVTLYQGRRPVDVPAPWQESVRDGVNVTYLATSTALSLWSAWDAYRIAEEKNRASQ